MLRILGIAILAIAAGGGYYGYTYLFPRTTVTTSVAMSAPVSEAIYGTGTVEPARWAKVVPLQRRRLVDLCTCEGQTVKAGQVLGRQDDAEERNALNQLQISSQQAQRDLDRAEKDRTKSDAAQKEYEQRWTQARGSTSRGSRRSRCGSTSSCCARRSTAWCCGATARSARSWDRPTCCSGSARPLPMQVVAEVNEEEINRIAVGQKAFLRSEAFPGTRRCAPRLPDHAQGRPDPQDLPRLSPAAERHAAADRHVGRGQHHLPREACGHRRARQKRSRANAVQIVE